MSSRSAGEGMIKLVYCITKKPTMSDEAFLHYWRNIHAPIGARIPGIRKFVQSRSLNFPGDRQRPDFDGLVELWFDDMAALLAARQSAEWKASTNDEANFIDRSKVASFVTEEHLVLGDTDR